MRINRYGRHLQYIQQNTFINILNAFDFISLNDRLDFTE
jgi:hypothetical protein